MLQLSVQADAGGTFDPEIIDDTQNQYAEGKQACDNETRWNN